MEISKLFWRFFDRGDFSKFGKISMLTGVDFSKLFSISMLTTQKCVFWQAEHIFQNCNYYNILPLVKYIHATVYFRDFQILKWKEFFTGIFPNYKVFFQIPFCLSFVNVTEKFDNYNIFFSFCKIFNRLDLHCI